MVVIVFIRLLFVCVTVLVFVLQRVYLCCDVSPRSGRAPFLVCVCMSLLAN